MKRNILPLILCAAMLAGATPAMAEEPSADTDTQQQATVPEPVKPARMLDLVTINQISTDQETGAVTELSTTDGEGNAAKYHISSNTLIIDFTGKAMTAADLTGIDKAYIFRSTLADQARLPQLTAEAIVVNVPQDAVCPMLHTIESIHNAGDTVQMTTDNGGLHLFVKTDTPTALIGSEKPYTAKDVKIGDRVFAWYSLVLESYPAQANPTRLVTIPAPDGNLSLIANGTDISDKAIMKNGVAFVPLRATATALGCNVVWDPVGRSTRLFNERRTMRLREGDDLYISASADPNLSGMTAPQRLGAAPFISEDGVKYVPAQVFTVLVGYTVSLNGHTLTITQK